MPGTPQTPLGIEPARLTLGRFLTDVCALHADHEAVVFEGSRCTYADLHDEALALARGLVGAGVVKGSRVALLTPNRPEWITAAFAVGMLGGVLVPVSTLATPTEREILLRHSDASVLLFQPAIRSRNHREELLSRHPELASGMPGRVRCPALPQLRSVFQLEGDKVGAIQSWAQLQSLGTDVPDELVEDLEAEVDPSDDAVIVYTSGSTGLPKGVIHRHRAAVTQFWRFSEQFGFDGDERVYSAQPFFWTAGIAMTLGCCLASGSTLLLEQVFEPGHALEVMESERATAFLAWAHQTKALAEHPDAPERDLTSLRRVGADSPLGRLIGAKGQAWGPGAAYGLTETFTLCASIPSDSPLELRRSTHGRPLPGMEIRIVDPEGGAELPTDTAGEIRVRGITLMRGYNKLAPERVFDAEGFYATGDSGSLDDRGFLHWSGRLGDLIKTGGANVSPREIEGVLERCPGLRAGLAVGVPHPLLGEIVVLCAIAARGEHPTEQSVVDFLSVELARYKLPRRVLFFDPSELELTGNEKIRTEPLRVAALDRLEAEGAEIAGHCYRPHSPS